MSSKSNERIKGNVVRTIDIINYELGNERTVLFHINKSVCRVYEVSAYWIASHLPIEKIHIKKSCSLDANLLYVWFHTSKLEDVIERMSEKGFHPVIRSNKHIVLKNEDITDNANFDSWRTKVLKNAEPELVG